VPCLRELKRLGAVPPSTKIIGRVRLLSRSGCWPPGILVLCQCLSWEDGWLGPGAWEEEDISEMKEGPSKHISKHMKPPWIYCELPFTPLQGSLPPFKNSLLMRTHKAHKPLRRELNLMDLMDIREWRFKGDRLQEKNRRNSCTSCENPFIIRFIWSFGFDSQTRGRRGLPRRSNGRLVRRTACAPEGQDSCQSGLEEEEEEAAAEEEEEEEEARVRV